MYTLLLLTTSTNYTAMSEYISKSTLTNLFHTSIGYHRRRLREIFRAHFNPYEKHVWTKDLSQRVLNELRLHLSWDLGIRTFHWSREAIGTRIIYRFKELGILLFMKQIIKDDRKYNRKCIN